MHVKEVGHASLHGWRGRLADRTAQAVSKRTPASEDAIRAALGLVFLALSVRYLARTVRDLSGRGRR
jgi:hypothetical protein